MTTGKTKMDRQIKGSELRRSYGRNNRVLLIFLVVSSCLTYISCKDSVEEDACSVYDSCKVRQFFRTCSCDSDCHRYSTCCRGAPKFSQMKRDNDEFQCYSEGTPSPVFAKRTCADGWNGDPAIEEGCVVNSTVNMTADFMSQVLVSSNKSEVTYWNWNCALCNHEEMHNLIFWTVQVSCFVDGLKSRLSIPQAKTNLAHNNSGPHWGIVAEEKFVPCSVSFYQPAFLMGRLRLCAPNMISSCPSNWTGTNVEENCLSFHGERKWRQTGLYFRNAYCAKCNGVRLKDLECIGRSYRTEYSIEDYRVLKVIFNLNSWTGEHGQASRNCLVEGERYDPFLRVCRDLSLGITNISWANTDYEATTPIAGAPLSTTPHFVWLLILLIYHFVN